MRRKIPTGSIYQRSYMGRAGKKHTASTWTLKYYVQGQPIRQSSGTENRSEALHMLRQRMAKFSQYADYSEQLALVLMNQLFDLVIEDYKFNKRAITYDAELPINKYLRSFFGHRRVADVGSIVIKKYTAQRASDAEAATVNKELAYLRRAFRLGIQTAAC
jgi:hypothetical protein